LSDLVAIQRFIGHAAIYWPSSDLFAIQRDAKPADRSPMAIRSPNHQSQIASQSPNHQSANREMDGILIIDKPSGLTSHDVVAAARRVLGQRRIGHTGTLDPLATGVLPLACGRATRLVRFLSAADKEYEAAIRLGVATDTYDITGRETSRDTRAVANSEISDALRAFAGEYLQSPPPYSAKKVAGRRAYELARADAAVQPAPARVRVDRLELLDVQENIASIRLTCSAGFYVRSLAHDLGVRLGVGACLAALRRTRSGAFLVRNALPLSQVVSDVAMARSRMVPLAALLPDLPAVHLTPEGVRRVQVGRSVEPAQTAGGAIPAADGWVRLLNADGGLVALARGTDGGASLHPSIVLH
jgi:tRNA pseudouridine55 synthase